jgi:hypothetical protein
MWRTRSTTHHLTPIVVAPGPRPNDAWFESTEHNCHLIRPKGAVFARSLVYTDNNADVQSERGSRGGSGDPIASHRGASGCPFFGSLMGTCPSSYAGASSVRTGTSRVHASACSAHLPIRCWGHSRSRGHRGSCPGTRRSSGGLRRRPLRRDRDHDYDHARGRRDDRPQRRVVPASFVGLQVRSVFNPLATLQRARLAGCLDPTSAPD